VFVIEQCAWHMAFTTSAADIDCSDYAYLLRRRTPIPAPWSAAGAAAGCALVIAFADWTKRPSPHGGEFFCQVRRQTPHARPAHTGQPYFRQVQTSHTGGCEGGKGQDM
jgi:hypothetical protein